MIVLDSSVVVEFLLSRDSDAKRAVIWAMGSGRVLSAPELLDVEVAQVIRRYELRRELERETATELVSLCAALPVVRFPHLPLLRRAFEHRHRLSVYDGVYVALAEGLEATLLTGDRGLVDAPGVRADVRFAATSG